MDVHGACPLDCPDTCSWIVTVEEGRAVRMRGNRDHPFTRGALCAKVNHYLEHTQAADRLLHPLRRTGRKGEGKFERISWDEALAEIAERLLAVRDEFGGEAIWPFQGTGTLGYIQGLEGRAGQRLWNVLGASSHDLTICSIAGSVGARYTNGTNTGMDPETFAHSKLILLWGTNTLTSGHHLWKFMNAAKKDGAHIVAIDPLRTRTADQAHEHLAPLPGTDAALALGLLHVVLDEGAEDKDYLASRTLGWEEFRDRILEFPPDRVARITGLPQERIVELGKRLAHTRPTGIRATMGIQRHAGGGMALRTLNAIPGVTGDWRHPGGGVSYSTSGYFGADRKALWRDDLLQRPVRSLAHTNIAANLLDLDDPPVKALVIYGANPMSSNPGSAGVRKGLLREDLFTVVMEQFPTDTVDYADIVLPATMQTEHLDLHEGYGHMYLLLNEPAVEPAGEALSTTETFRRLARALGLTEPSLYDSDEQQIRTLLGSGPSSAPRDSPTARSGPSSAPRDSLTARSGPSSAPRDSLTARSGPSSAPRDSLTARSGPSSAPRDSLTARSGHPSLEGITYERLQAEGWVRLNYATPFVPFADGFPTPSGKLEFRSETAAADGYDPLPGYTPPAEAATPSADYPLALLAPASHWFLNSTFANHPGLRARAGGPRIELHPDDAAARGLETGDEARVFNARGEFIAAVEVSDRVRPGVIASTKGHWLKHVRGGANANATVPERDSDMGRGAVFHDNRVQVESARSSASSARLSGTSSEWRSAARTTAPVSASYSSGRPASRS